MTGNDINDKIQNEIKRVFLLLPKIEPGKNNNKEVSVNYSIPIKLAVNKKKPKLSFELFVRVIGLPEIAIASSG
jgi:hypothetical protein